MSGDKKAVLKPALSLLAFAATVICTNIVCVKYFNEYVFIVLINIFLGAAAAFFMLYFYEKRDNEALKNESAKLRAEKELIYIHYKPLEDNVLQINKYCHDARNILNLLWYSNEKNKETEKLAIDFVTTGEELCKSKICENHLINAVLNQKKEQAREREIGIDISAAVGEELNIDSMDICRLLVNILDNAIEANTGGDASFKKHISLELKTAGSRIVINEKNTCLRLPDSDFKTRKSGKNHGLGLQIIKDIVKKYDGKIDIDINNNIFTLSLCV